MNKTSVCAALAAALVIVASPARAAWTPPAGIPAPSFGINETAPAVPNPWTTATAGFYYVDATQSAATDSSNPYGTPARPRRTIPTVLPAGAVVELHGTYDFDQTSPNGILSQGTATRPVFIRGASSSARPLIRNNWEVTGTYYILENLEFGPLNSTQTGDLAILAPTNHAALRNSELHGNVNGGGLGVVSWSSALTQNVVVYKTNIHDNGDVNATYDQDVHGIAVSLNVDHLWVLDSTLARNSGDGIQINAGSASLQPTTHHIYVGRNTAYGNKQTGFWAKQAVDVVFSQNECHSHRPSDSSFGQCMGYQYATDWVWFLFNHVYDSEFGIVSAADGGLGTGTHAYFVGNLIHDIHHSESSYNPYTSWSSAGIMLAGGVDRRVVNNTIYDVDAGINVPATGGTLEIADNVISNVTVAAASHVFVENQSLANITSLHHVDLAGNARINYGGTTTQLTAAQLSAMASTNADPKFVNASGGDFHLQSTSPVINKGETNGVYSLFQQRYGFSIQVDRDGTTRPQGAAMDMGAYEYGGTSTTPPPTATPKISVTPTSVLGGRAVAATVSNGPGNAFDWIGLYQTGSSDQQVLDYRFLNGQLTPAATGVTTATVSFAMPPKAGTYELRMFSNGTMTKLATSSPISVQALSPVITATPIFVPRGGTITVKLSGGPCNATDWAGLYAAGAPVSNRLDWRYLNGSQTPPSAGLTAATITFKAPAQSGLYQVRWFANSSVMLLATSQTILVY